MSDLAKKIIREQAARKAAAKQLAKKIILENQKKK